MVVQFITCQVAHLERNGLHTLSLCWDFNQAYSFPLILKTQPVFTLAAYGVYNVHCKAEAAQLNEEDGLPCTTCPTLPLNFQTLCWGSALPVSHQTEREVYSSGRLSPAGLGGGAPFVWPAQRTFTHPASRHEGGGDLQISTTTGIFRVRFQGHQNAQFQIVEKHRKDNFWMLKLYWVYINKPLCPFAS